MPFRPTFTGLATLNTYLGLNLFNNQPCAAWESLGQRSLGLWDQDDRSLFTVATDLSLYQAPAGWSPPPRTFDPLTANVMALNMTNFTELLVHVETGAKWDGTAYQHARFYCARFPTAGSVVVLPGLPGEGYPILAYSDIYRPFGSATRVQHNVVCYVRLAPQIIGAYSGGGNIYFWTHTVDFSGVLDVRDGSSRASGLDVQSYSDGDEIRLMSVSSGPTQFVGVIVYVKVFKTDATHTFTRCYVMRDHGLWPARF